MSPPAPGKEGGVPHCPDMWQKPPVHLFMASGPEQAHTLPILRRRHLFLPEPKSLRPAPSPAPSQDLSPSLLLPRGPFSQCGL